MDLKEGDLINPKVYLNDSKKAGEEIVKYVSKNFITKEEHEKALEENQKEHYKRGLQDGWIQSLELSLEELTNHLKHRIKENKSLTNKSQIQ